MKKKEHILSLKNRTILQILPTLEAGGVTQGVLDIAQALCEKGARAIVVANKGPRSNDLHKTGAFLITFPVDSKNPLTLLKNSQRLAQIFEEEKIDLVHARSRAPAWSAWFACRRKKIPFVTTFHGTYNFKSSFKKFYNSVMVRGDRVIAISDFIKKHILTQYQSYIKDDRQVHLIHRGIDIHYFSPEQITPKRVAALRKAWNIPAGKIIFLVPGRLTRWKGHKVVLKALALLKKDLDFYCVFLGSDQGRSSYRQEIEQDIVNKDLPLQVKIIPGCADMPAAYALCDAVIHASTDPEAFGRVIAEASAMGKPVVATRHGAPQEIILEGITGWLVKPGDAEELSAMLKKIAHLSEKEKNCLGKTAQTHIRENFSLSQMCDKTLALYQDLLNEKGTYHDRK